MMRVAVGIGKDIRREELVRMTGDEELAIQTQSFDELKIKIEFIKELACGKKLALPR